MNKLRIVRFATGAGLLTSMSIAGVFLFFFYRTFNTISLVDALTNDNFFLFLACICFSIGLGVLLRSLKPSTNSAQTKPMSSNSAGLAASSVAVSILPVGATIVFNGDGDEGIQNIVLTSDAFVLPPSFHSKGKATEEAANPTQKPQKERLFTQV